MSTADDLTAKLEAAIDAAPMADAGITRDADGHPWYRDEQAREFEQSDDYRIALLDWIDGNPDIAEEFASTDACAAAFDAWARRTYPDGVERII